MTALVLVLTGVLIAVQFRADLQMARNQVERDAHIVAIQYSSIFHASAQTLKRIEEAMSALADGEASAVRDITIAVRDLPPDFMHAVFSANGDLVMTSVPDPRPFGVSDRDYFRRAKAGEELVISPVLVWRNRTEEVIIMARRLERDGQFAGVAVIGIPMAMMEELAESLALEQGSIISLSYTDGRLIARWPSSELPADVSSSPLFELIKQKPNGFYETSSLVDGVDRIIGYWMLDGWPVVATIGFDREKVFDAFGRQAWAAIWLALPALGALVWLMYQLGLTLRRDEAHQAELEAANAKSGFLLREIHHRVKNNMQTVSSLIRMERIPPDVKRSLLSRIQAMSAVHEGMYRSDEYETVEVEPYLKRLIANLASGYGGNVRVDATIAPVTLSGDRAMQLGLLANEAISNAFKHAFSDDKEGHLRVDLAASGENELTLTVQDDGPGFDPATTPRNMGSQLVEAFAAQLGGDLTIDATAGTTLRVVFPLALVQG